MTAPTPETLARLKTAAWVAVRRYGKTGLLTDLDHMQAAMWDVEAACEQYRAAFYPQALKLFVVCDHEIGQPLSIWIVTATGAECVHEAERVAS